MLPALLLGLFACQDPAPAGQKPPEAAPAAASAVAAWDDKTAKAAVDALQKALKGNASMAERNRALEALAGGSHKLLVKPLAQVIENDKSVVLRRRAAVLLGNQPAAEANAQLRKLLKSSKATAAHSVTADLVRSLSRCGYTGALWSELEDHFERDYSAERVVLQEALLELVIAHREKQALKLLLRNLDEPAPANPEDPSNPPAEYWEARWKAWKVWKPKVAEALFAITGQRFQSAAEAKAWLDKNPLR